jgi:hypothetical protein
VFHHCDFLVGPQIASLIRLNEDVHRHDKAPTYGARDCLSQDTFSLKWSRI